MPGMRDLRFCNRVSGFFFSRTRASCRTSPLPRILSSSLAFLYARSGSKGSLIGGLPGGTLIEVVCHPLDEVKKRFQIEGLKRHPIYDAQVKLNAYRNIS
ncbi:unnamed protein product [Cuscuta europaea]|uniref:Uncharacterized protein n=1 Tax=Cuscuta europaea TaxID=41803 RepID=A0A9P0ZM36_CUSEU|nr:unnamed protein product [Cuscuta europaea]